MDATAIAHDVTPVEETPAEARPQSTLRRLRKPALIAAALGAVAFGSVRGATSLSAHLGTEETDDAQVEGHIAPVLPRVAGQVTKVLVRDHEVVRAGQVLARLDDRDLRVKREMASAALASAEAALAASEANVKAAEATRIRSTADLERYGRLLPAGDIPQQQYDAAKASAEAAEAQHAAALKQVAAAAAQVAQRRSDLDYADLQVSYTTLVAPADGTVTKKGVEVGQYVQAGQSLMAIAQDEEVWVVANFKETQVGRMRVGQSVSITVDAYPGVEMHGRIDSVAPNTGARLALFPPDNATGNFTKVVQRVPVKIVIDGAQRPEAPLRIGMSVAARVKVS
jgi:membrane fusion protein (multidrug efflux system)